MKSTPEGSHAIVSLRRPSQGLVHAAVEPTGRSRSSVAVCSVLAAVMLWSTSYVVTKVGVGDIPPLTFGAIRFLVAAILAILLALVGRRVEAVPLKDALLLVCGGLLGITAYFSLQNLGVQRTSASDATLLVASFPAITMLLEATVLGKRVSLVRLAGVGIAFTGVFLIIQQSATLAGAQRLEGDMLLLATGLAWALYNLVTPTGHPALFDVHGHLLANPGGGGRLYPPGVAGGRCLAVAQSRRPCERSLSRRLLFDRGFSLLRFRSQKPRSRLGGESDEPGAGLWSDPGGRRLEGRVELGPGPGRADCSGRSHPQRSTAKQGRGRLGVNEQGMGQSRGTGTVC